MQGPRGAQALTMKSIRETKVLHGGQSGVQN
jgi:hypothetical protein